MENNKKRSFKAIYKQVRSSITRKEARAIIDLKNKERKMHNKRRLTRVEEREIIESVWKDYKKKAIAIAMGAALGLTTIGALQTLPESQVNIPTKQETISTEDAKLAPEKLSKLQQDLRRIISTDEAKDIATAKIKECENKDDVLRMAKELYSDSYYYNTGKKVDVNEITFYRNDNNRQLYNVRNTSLNGYTIYENGGNNGSDKITRTLQLYNGIKEQETSCTSSFDRDIAVAMVNGNSYVIIDPHEEQGTPDEEEKKVENKVRKGKTLIETAKVIDLGIDYALYLENDSNKPNSEKEFTEALAGYIYEHPEAFSRDRKVVLDTPIVGVNSTIEKTEIDGRG